MEHILLLNISLKKAVDLKTIIRALGDKREHIQNIVQESNIVWKDEFLEFLPLDDLFGQSAEKIAEGIIAVVQQT